MVKIMIYKTIILPYALCWHETWSHTLKEGHKLQGFGNRVLRKIYETQKNKVIEQLMILHNK
jgi:hypothetical protein